MMMMLTMTPMTTRSFILCHCESLKRPTEGMTILTPTSDEDAMMAALKEAAEVTET